MALPPLLRLSGETAYRNHFEKHYVCGGPVVTFDGIKVRFFARAFYHAFFRESARGSGLKDMFDWLRAERMDWIGHVLRDSTVELYRRVMARKGLRRIALVPQERYAVIIAVEKNLKRATFVTAYAVNSDSALRKMRGNPKW